METNYAELVNETDTPHLMDWLRRINERPATRAMYAAGPGRPAPHAQVIADELKSKATA